jgi:hypothetical protein
MNQELDRYGFEDDTDDWDEIAHYLAINEDMRREALERQPGA